jgi:hypothetical protein
VEEEMTGKIKVALMLCALLLGVSVTTAAQTRTRSRGGRDANVYYGNRPYKQQDRRDRDRYDRDRHRGRYDDHQRGRDDWRDDRYGYRNQRRQVYRQPQVYGARRTYRLPNGRLVTILPNGRRIYH